MAWYPGARRRQIEHNFSDKTTSKNAVILHTTASASATSMYSWFNNPGANASSHFHVDTYGNVEQYIDTAKRSWASGDGNSRSVSIETQGDGTEPWTSSQITALVKLVSWICDTHSIAKRQMANSDDRGIGWHRLGVDGDFPDGLLGGRQQTGGSETWSSAFGKTCPGTPRIKQIPDILDQVKGGTDSAAASADDDGERTPRDPDDGKWPEAYLTVRDHHTTYSHTAWRDLMHRIGIEKDSFTLECQTWLADLKDAAGRAYYTGRIDDDFGPMTTTALQEFLRDKGHYTGLIDGDRGPMTIKAEHKYLNEQAEIIVNL